MTRHERRFVLAVRLATLVAATLLSASGAAYAARPAAVPKPTPPPASAPARPLTTKERIKALEADVERLTRALHEAKTALSDHAARTRDFTATASDFTKRLDELEGEIEALSSDSVAAEDEAGEVETIDARLTELELRVAEDEGTYVRGSLGGFVISGAVVTAVYYLNGPDLTLNGTLVDPQNEFHFLVDTLEIDFARRFAGLFRLRLDLDVGIEHRFGGGSDFAVSIEQAFGEATIPVLDGIMVRLGRWSDEIGWEPTDRQALWTFSHSAGFTLIQPKLLTGLRIAMPLFDRVEIGAMVVNGIGDNFDVKNIGKTLAFTVELGAPLGKRKRRRWWLRAGFLVGSEQPEEVDSTANFRDATLIASLAFEFPISNLRVGGQLLYKGVHDAHDGIAEFQGRSDTWGGALALVYPLFTRFEAVLRYDLIIDRRGLFFDSGLLLEGAGEMHAMTLGFGAKLIEGARAGLEYKAELFLANEEIGPSCKTDAGVSVTCGGILGRDGAAHSVAGYFKITF